jgi:hypothetical protein
MAAIDELNDKARSSWDENKNPSEKIEIVIKGGAITAAQYIVGTNQRVLIIKPPFMPFASTSFTDFPYKKVNGIAFKLGLSGGYVAIQGAGLELPEDIDDALSSPSAIGLPRLNTDKSKTEAGVKKLRGLVDAAQESSGAAPKGGGVSRAEELMKLKELMDAGILSKKEFDAEKKRLLST